MYLSSVCRKLAVVQACYEGEPPEQASSVFSALQVTSQSALPPRWPQAAVWRGERVGVPCWRGFSVFVL